MIQLQSRNYETPPLESTIDQNPKRPISRYVLFRRSPNDPQNTCLYVGADETSLHFRLSHPEDYKGAVLSLARELECVEYEREDDLTNDLVGSFDLNCVVVPVQEWEFLEIADVNVVTTRDGESIIGLRLTVSFGIRIGIFAGPYNGLCLSFNDTCDTILRQAVKAEDDGLVAVISRTFPNVQTCEIDAIDWYDWLRTCNQRDV